MRCQVPICKKQVDHSPTNRYVFLCSEHWNLVPQDLAEEWDSIVRRPRSEIQIEILNAICSPEMRRRTSSGSGRRPRVSYEEALVRLRNRRNGI